MQPLSNIRTITASTSSLTITTPTTSADKARHAQSWLENGNTLEAVRSLDEAIKILTSDPTYNQNHYIEAPLASGQLASASSSASVERALQAIKSTQCHLEKGETLHAKHLLNEAKKILTDGLSCDQKRDIDPAHEEEDETVGQVVIGDRQTAIKGSDNTIERARYATEANVGAAESKKRPADHLIEAMNFVDNLADKIAPKKGRFTLQVVMGEDNSSVHGNTNRIIESQTVTSAATSSSANPGDAKLESNEFSPRKAGNMEE